MSEIAPLSLYTFTKKMFLQVVAGRGHDPYNDDAVYMESQAFLMHEIMTDGMAFCSIV
jgi:hypothetical protein